MKYIHIPRITCRKLISLQPVRLKAVLPPEMRWDCVYLKLQEETPNYAYSLNKYDKCP